MHHRVCSQHRHELKTMQAVVALRFSTSFRCRPILKDRLAEGPNSRAKVPATGWKEGRCAWLATETDSVRAFDLLVQGLASGGGGGSGTSAAGSTYLHPPCSAELTPPKAAEPPVAFRQVATI